MIIKVGAMKPPELAFGLRASILFFFALIFALQLRPVSSEGGAWGVMLSLTKITTTIVIVCIILYLITHLTFQLTNFCKEIHLNFVLRCNFRYDMVCNEYENGEDIVVVWRSSMKIEIGRMMR